MRIEHFPRWHAHDPRLDSFVHELLVGGDAERDLAAGSEQHDFRLGIGGVGENIRALRNPAHRRVSRAIEDGQCLSRQDQANRAVMNLQDRPIGLGHLVGVRGPENNHPRHGA